MKLKKRMKVLVTGGAGYIGSHVVVKLIEAGYKPIIIDNLSNSEETILDRIYEISDTKPIFYKGDVRDYDFLENVFDQEDDITGIIHFAAFKAVEESIQKPLQYYDNNINGLLTILKISQKRKIKNFVFSSSATVYGVPDKNPISETQLVKSATNPYGDTKAIAENILKALVVSNANIKTIALRYFNPIGAHPSGLIGELPKGTPANLVPYITQTAAGLKDKLFIFGNNYNTIDGTCVRDYIHVEDLADAHIQTLEFLKKKEKQSFYDVYNVGTGNGTSVMELMKTFEKINKITIPFEISQRRPGDIAMCYADTTKIERDMNWKSKKTVEEALRDSWRWQQNCSK